MLVTVAVAETNDILTVEVNQETTLKQLKERIEFQTAIPSSKQAIHFNGNLLQDDNKTMETLQITPDSMVAVLQKSERQPRPQAPAAAQPPPAAAAGSGGGTADLARQLRRFVQRQQQQQQRPNQTGPLQAGGQAGGAQPFTMDPEQLRQGYLSSPDDLNRLRQQLPQLADAINDPEAWARETEGMRRRQAELQQQRARDLALLEADPFDVEAQKRIEELIRLERVNENLDQAREYHPEAFGRVTMLYINVEVNGVKVKAFVDSGAQSTIMSPDCAEKCGIMRLLDTRWAGIARGVGTAKILGRVHSASIKVGSHFLPCSFTVMEGKDVDLLLGLDMLRRYQACIDLGKSVLRIEGDEVPFLGEAEIPRSEEERASEPTVDGPGGSKIGGISGAVKDPGNASSNFSTQATDSAAATSSQQPSAPNPQSSAPSTTSTGTVQGQASFPESDIMKLMEMGMDRGSAIQLLTLAEGMWTELPVYFSPER